MINLTDSISSLRGIGPSTSDKLEKLGILTVIDLLRHLPRRHLDYSHPTTINHLQNKKPSSFIAKLSPPKSFFTKSRKLIIQSQASDATGKITLTWFNNPYIKKLINPETQYSIAGTPAFFGSGLTIISPSIEEGDSLTLNTSGFVPVYPLTAGITSRWLRNKIHELLENISVLDPLAEASFIDLQTAYHQIHFPTTQKEKDQADKRLSYNSHLQINLTNLLERHAYGNSVSLKINPEIHKQSFSKIPFVLTLDQEKTIQSLYKDLKSAEFTHRLIEGDTGSGKTATLVFATNQCLSQNFSCAILAPTEILARQHFDTFKNLSLYPNQIQLVTSHTTVPSFETPTLYIGTHSLLKHLPVNLLDPLIFVAIDEQHKFGVQQRESLIHRTPMPHLVNLSATPIPRTVALGLLGDLNISHIDTLPQNRLQTKTHIISKSKLNDGKIWLSGEIESGNQIFVVCPRINNTGDEVDSVDKLRSFYQTFFDNKIPTLTLHGQIKQDEQTRIINKFKLKEASILISTSIIEVGIDIPSANIVIIHSADLFGLAQLHQLRGRVGRGGAQGHCFLITTKDDEEINERLELLKKYRSGLTLAKKDLILRGAGEIFGLKQHGQIKTSLKYFWSKKLFLLAKSDAKKIVTQNPTLAKSIATQLDFC